MSETRTQVARFVNCHRCWTEGTCQVEFAYNENGRIVGAKVVALPEGWIYRPLPEGSEEPICPRCA